MRKIFIKEEKRLPYSVVFTIVPLASAVLTFVVFYLQYYSLNDITYGLKNAGLTIFILNFLPILMSMLLLLFISGRLSVAFFLTSLITVLLTLINRTKIIMRQDPLMPTDFSLGTEAFTIVMNMEAGSIAKYVVIILAVILFGAALIMFFKNKPVRISVRISGAVIVIAASAVLYSTTYSDVKLYDSLPVGNLYYLANHYNTKGFVYCFIHQVSATGVLSRKAPDGYKKTELVRLIEEEYSSKEYSLDGAPHVVVIMGEAFSDLSDRADLEFTNYRDPLTNFKKLKEQGVSGEIIVTHTGGGTSDTEFDVLTGMSKREEESVSYAFRLLSKQTESIASDLTELGYKSIFVHPGTGWFYNRKNVYSLMGFEDLYFSEYFGDSPTKGGYINEYDTVDAVINLFEEKRRENPGSPIFEFCVSIQNHGPYESKYSTWEMNFDSEADLSDSEINILSNYFQGITDQDENLGRLADYLNSLDEPVLLMYFGDHMPSMPVSLFKNIGLSFDFGGDFLERMELFTTPYLFWQNDCYRQQTGQIAENGQNAPLISANFLGASLLEFIGYGEISPMNKFLNELKRDIPVITKNEYVTKDGYKSFDDLSEPEKNKILLYKQWQYYKLYDD